MKTEKKRSGVWLAALSLIAVLCVLLFAGCDKSKPKETQGATEPEIAGVNDPVRIADGATVSFSTAMGKNRNGQPSEQVTITFPAAKPSATSRVYRYEVQALAFHEDKDYPVATKRVHAEKFFLPVARESATNRCVFAFSELPERETLVFAVRPVECFGRKGHESLSAPWRRPAPSPAATDAK